MISVPFDLRPLCPMQRETALEFATLADRFPCTLTLKGKGIILNLKSTIGLLSQAIPMDCALELVADGEEEERAAKEIQAYLNYKLKAKR